LVVQSLWDELLTLQPSATMRQFLDKHGAQIHYLNLNTPSILQDLDTPQDYRYYQPNKANS
jgi:hypothetical protein